MKISELLLEYNENLLVQNFAAKIESHAKLDTTAPKNLNGQQLIQQIAKENKDLAFWISLNYANYTDKKFNGGIQRWEDIASRAIPDLEEFKVLLRKPNLSPPLPIRDINQIKGLNALFNILKPYREQEQPITDEEEQKFVTSNQVKIVINKPNLKVVVPLTKQAAIFYGRGTQWCTSAKNNNKFSTYSKDGPLYIILAGGEKYQWHFETSQYVDSSDSPIDPLELAMKYPALIEIISPGTTGNFWDRLVQSKNSDILAKVAEDEHTPPDILSRLSANEDWIVRGNVAGNPNTPPEVLNKLSHDTEDVVLYYLAKNKNIPVDVLTGLVKLADSSLVQAAASNYNLPTHILSQLSKDDNRDIRATVAGNPNTERGVLIYLSKDEDWIVRAFVAENPNTPDTILSRLSKDARVDVRWQVARNPNTPINILSNLSRDITSIVSTSAINAKTARKMGLS